MDLKTIGLTYPRLISIMAKNFSSKRSIIWYLLPTIFCIVGGVLAYFILKNDDPSKAKNCLWLGIILFSFYAAYYLVFSILIGVFEFS